MPPTKVLVFAYVAQLDLGEGPFTAIVTGKDLPQVLKVIAARWGRSVHVLNLRRSIRLDC